MAEIDVAGPINRLRQEAERQFDAKIAELMPLEQKVVVAANSAYRLGLLTEAFKDFAVAFEVAFRQGQRDYRRQVGRG